MERNILIAFAFAVTRLFLGAFLGHIFSMLGIKETNLLDDAVFGVWWGLVVFLVLQEISRIKQQHHDDKKVIVSQMNHHVRNALQIIEYGAWASKDKLRFKQILEAIAVIDWSLREVLSGGLVHKPVEQHDVPTTVVEKETNSNAVAENSST